MDTRYVVLLLFAYPEQGCDDLPRCCERLGGLLKY